MKQFNLSQWTDNYSNINESSLSVIEKCLVIIHSCCCTDDKLNALYNLYRWADSKSEKENVKLIYEYYRFVLQQLCADVEGSLYVFKDKDNPDSIWETDTYSGFINKIDACTNAIVVERYVPTEQGLQKLISVNYNVLNGVLCEDGFTLNRILAQADFEEDDIEKFNKAEQLLNLSAE